ncbi:hypothetical protein FGG78_20705 [Thioclava sp. BHET1]|nr:hypothetical protein FGG78_20705 [Thioclava sp. BHET1]
MMQKFLSEIEEYLERTGMKPSTFGRLFLNDPSFVFRLRNNGECRASTIEAVRDKMRETLSVADATTDGGQAA